MRTANTNNAVAVEESSPNALTTLKSLYALSKPGIVNLTLVAALAGMYLGNAGFMPDVSLLVWTMLTLGLATAGACMLNNVYDRDIDQIMKRTASRPLAAGEVSVKLTFIVGVLLATVPVFVMAAMVNFMAAGLTAAAVFGYVIVYTMMAKRRTPWANQIGGIAGALPPVIGVAAVTGSITIEAVILFLIMAVWQQPHALSLALKYRDDYARAKVPVIPVAKGVQSTKWRIFIYTIVLTGVCILPYVLGFAGLAYLVTAVILSGMFMYKAFVFLRSDRDYDIRLFLFSLVHLTVICAVLVYDFKATVV